MTQEGANIRKGDYDQTASQRERTIKTRAFFLKKKSRTWELVWGKGLKWQVWISREDWVIVVKGHLVTQCGEAVQTDICADRNLQILSGTTLFSGLLSSCCGPFNWMNKYLYCFNYNSPCHIECLYISECGSIICKLVISKSSVRELLICWNMSSYSLQQTMVTKNWTESNHNWCQLI